MHVPCGNSHRDRTAALHTIVRCDELASLTRNLELLVRRDDEELHAAAIIRDFGKRRRRANSCVPISVFVETRAEKFEALRDSVPNRRAVLADAG